MEEAFDKLKSERKNDVDNLIKWMKEAKIIDGSNVTEEKARQYFNEASNQQDVQLESFKAVLSKVAAEKGTEAQELQNALASKGQAIVSALSGAATALAGAFK